MKNRSFLVCAALLVCHPSRAATLSATAAPVTWDFNTTAAWAGALKWTSNADTANFNQSGAGLTVTVNTTTNGQVGTEGVNFNNASGNWILNGAAGTDTLQLGAGGIVHTLTNGSLIVSVPLRLTASQTWSLSANRGFTVNGGISSLAGTTNLTFDALNAAGVTSGAPSPTLKMAGTNTYTGATTVKNNASLSLDYTANNTTRLDDLNGVTLQNSAALAITGNTAADTSETINTLAINTGPQVLTVASAVGRVTSLSGAALSNSFSRSGNATALVRGTNLNQSAATNVSRIVLADGGASLGLVGGAPLLNGGATSDATKGLKIVPCFIGDTSVTGLGSHFVTYDSTLGLRVLLGTEETTLIPASTTAANPENALAGANVVLTGSPVTVNSLLFNSGSASTLNSTSAQVLTVKSGAVASVDNQTNSIGGGFSALNLDNSEGIVTVTQGTLTFATPVDVTNAGTHLPSGGNLTKTGLGTLVFTVPNFYSGTTILNQGTLQIGNGGTTGDLANTTGVVINGGTLAFNRSNSFSYLPALIGSGLGGVSRVAGSGQLTVGVVSGIATLADNSTTGSVSPTTVNQSGTGLAIGTVNGASGSVVNFAGDGTGSTTFSGRFGTAGQLVKLTNGTVFLNGAGSNQTQLANMELNGGVLTVNAASDRFATDSTAAGQTLTITGGQLLVPTTAGYGLRLNGTNGVNGSGTAGSVFTGTQSNGLVTVLKGGNATSFNLGSTSATVSIYNLQGGTVNALGTGTDGRVELGADTAGTGKATFNLSGGKLVASGQISGNQGTAARQAFVWTGGRLATAAYIATNLTSTDGAAYAGNVGTLTNNGGTLAPGDIGTAGKTTITGGYSVNAGTLAIDLGGTTQATAFQTGQHDFISVSGTATLGGNLTVSLLAGFTPQNAHTFTVLTAGSLVGAFANAPFAGRVATSDGSGTFLVTKSGNSIVLGDWQPTVPPGITSQPSSLTVLAGNPATFTVGATGATAYQWRKGTVPINGANAASYTITPVSANNAGTYDVIVSTALGSITSDSATLTVNLFGSDVLGQRPITYNFNGVRPVSTVPAAEVHPRVYFNAEELPAIRDRLTNTAVGAEAFKMVKMYTAFLRSGRSIAYDSQSSSYKIMPDGGGRCSNPGLYDRSAVYDQMIVGGTTILDTMINDGTGLYTLAGEMSLEAFECLVDAGQPGVAARSTDLAAALDTWATWVLTQADFPGAAGATNGGKFANHHRIGGHLSALTYDMIFNAMSQGQKDNVRKALAKLMGGYFASDSSSTEYTGVGCTAEAVATNWVAINSFKLVTACALEGDVTVADAGYATSDLTAWLDRAMGSYHKFLTYGWFATGAPLEGQGKNYLFGAHMIAFARRGYNFFGHPHLRAYSSSWLPAVTQPFGYSFTAFDLLGGTGSNVEKGKQYINGLDYVGLKWMLPGDAGTDFAWRNFVRTEYKDGGGNLQTYLDLRDGKFSIRSGYYNQLLPAAIFASDVGSTATWTQQNAAVRSSLDYLDKEGGNLVSRSGYDPDAAALLFHVRQDFGGHTFADRNTFTFSALGRIFVNYNSGGTSSGLQDAKFQSLVEVDGMSMKLTAQEGTKFRIPAKLAAWSPTGGDATFATGDATYGYSQEWRWNNYSTGPVTITSGYAAENNSHNTFRRAGNKIPESFGNAHFVSFPQWVTPGLFEGIQAKPYNPMRQVYRTAGLVRGVKPYALVIDDVRKDDSTHTYKWLASIAEDLTIVTGASLPPGSDPATDIVLQEPAATGNRRLLVRILRANGTPVLSTALTADGSTLAYTEIVDSPNGTENWKRLVIERSAVIAPDFRVLLFPFLNGDGLPSTSFAGNNLTITLGAQVDSFAFSPRTANVGGQTVTMNEFILTRNGTSLLDYRNQIEPTAVRNPAGILDTPPAAPTALTATALSETQVRLNWTDNASGESAYLVERALAGSENWTPLASTLAANSATFTDSSALPSTSYDYRIRASGVAGLSDFALVSIVTPTGIGDGIPGAWRYQYFGNGLAIIPGVSGPNDDPDGDGASNRQEYLSGTVPTDAASTFKIRQFGPAGAAYQITFTAIPGKTYAVERCSNLTTGNWVTVADDLTTTGTEIQTSIPPNPQGSYGFYRARVKN